MVRRTPKDKSHGQVSRALTSLTFSGSTGQGSKPLRTRFFRIDETSFGGHVVDTADATQRFIVELLLDGQPIRVARADVYVHELAIDGLGDGYYGFVFSLSPSALADSFVAEVRLANSTTPVGSPIHLRADAASEDDPRGPGSVEWLGGVRFEGWCPARSDQVPTIIALIDGEAVAQVRPTRWTQIGTKESARAVRGFDLHLPHRFADGRVRRVRFVTDDGQEVSSSPISFVAFPDGLARTLDRLGELESERLRGEFFDRLLPMSLPFTEYDYWQRRFSTKPEVNSQPNVAIVLIGTGDETVSLRSIEEQDYSDWVLGTLPEGRASATFEPDMLRSFLAEDAEQSEIVLFAPTGTQFSDMALVHFANAFAAFPEAVAAYADIDVAGPDQRAWPVAFSAFDYERMLEQGYCSHLFALRRASVEKAIAVGATDIYRLFNSIFDETRNVDKNEVIHIPTALGRIPPLDLASSTRALANATAVHLQRRGVRTNVSPGKGSAFPAVHVARVPQRASVTIVIPVRNKPELLRDCLRSIRRAATSMNAEIMIVDNDSSDPEMFAYLEEIDGNDALVIRVPGAFNFARLNNIAADKSQSQFLCLLNNDVQALDDLWLAEMLGRMTEPDVGAVGALLVWPSGVVQHGGVVLGTSFAATHAFNDRIQTDPGYADLLRVAHECSAVTAACLVTRRADYQAVGGMDELRFPVNFNDVDYCLKLAAAGKRIVFTPHARLLHLESASRGKDMAPDRARRFERELRVLRARWGDRLINDPYYNPMLSLDPAPFSALAWPPRSMAPRIGSRPVPADIPAGF